MIKPNFKLPTSTMCIVVWYRNGNKNETLIKTPATNDGLFNVMLTHRVGFSEIRSVKSVETGDLTRAMTRV
jgi:hypothetical protein